MFSNLHEMSKIGTYKDEEQTKGYQRPGERNGELLPNHHRDLT